MKAIFKSAVHIILINDNKILLQKRKGSKLWPGYYALPAGHIDEGETQYEALIREAKEELGIEINSNDIINNYVVLRRNFFEINGKILEPYIDYYFEIKKYKGIPKIIEEDKIVVLPNAIPVPEIYEKNYSSKKLIFLGRLCKEKGIGELIDAVSELRKDYPELQLYLGGSWVDQELKEKADSHGAWIHQLGWIDKEKKEKYLKECNIFAFLF